tara:strand:- start:272 stop:589 length:318 start_codon:yes stop_codon:yes gene_type:complete
MTLTSFNIIELSTASGTILAAVAMLLAQTQKSKCKNLKICWGCIVCDRTVDDVKEEEEEEDLESGKVDVERKEELNKNKIPIPKIELPINKDNISLPKVNIVVKK